MPQYQVRLTADHGLTLGDWTDIEMIEVLATPGSAELPWLTYVHPISGLKCACPNYRWRIKPDAEAAPISLAESFAVLRAIPSELNASTATEALEMLYLIRHGKEAS